jgi:simple sugar transport system substrate-binding protein
MKKRNLLVSALLLAIVSLTFAGGGQQGSGGGTGQPDSAAASGKIAVIRNMTSSDHTAQFFAGCIAEGKALGFTVDTFMSDGDDVKMQDLMEQVLQRDYAVWILSHANAGYQNEMVTKAVQKGIKVSCFDCGGDHVPGVSDTSQNDESLAKISLDALMEKAIKNGAKVPVKILEVNTVGAIVPFDNRHEVIKNYTAEGKITVVNMISPSLAGDIYSQIYNGVSTTLAQNGVGKVDGIWAASSAFNDAILGATKEAKRNEIVVTAIDISDTEIKRLVDEPQYYCCAAVDPFVIGIVNVRLAILNTLGIKTPETVKLEAVAVYGNQLADGDTMKTLNKYFSDFGSTDLFDTPEIQALKKQRQ